jgi:hypothetical protein
MIQSSEDNRGREIGKRLLEGRNIRFSSSASSRMIKPRAFGGNDIVFEVQEGRLMERFARVAVDPPLGGMLPFTVPATSAGSRLRFAGGGIGDPWYRSEPQRWKQSRRIVGGIASVLTIGKGVA